MKTERIKEIINEQIMLHEIFDKPIETEYTVVKRNLDSEIYTFNTNSGNEYCLVFYYDDLIDNRILKLIKDIDIKYVGIYFTLGEYIDNPKLSDNKTNKREQFELLNRIIYLVNRFIVEKNEIYVYFVGTKESTRNRMYDIIFNNIFSLDYLQVKRGFKSYFVNKKILK